MNSIKLEISNSLQELTKIESMVETALEHLEAPIDLSFKLQLCLDEILTNVINYGYPDYKSDVISILFEIQNGVLTVTISDNGIAFDPLIAKHPDTNKPLSDREIGGLGIHFVRKFSKEQLYMRHNEKNILKITFEK